MNEIFFLFHIILITAFTLGSLKLGKMALSSWVILQSILANLFVLKQIKLFTLHVTASDVFIIGGVFGLNLLQEHFDRKQAQKTTKNCLYFMLFFAILSQIHLLYEPSLFDKSQSSYLFLLQPAPRLLAASLTTFYLVQRLDIATFSWTRKKAGTSSFACRNCFTLVISQLVDTILFTFLGLYGIASCIFDIIVTSFAIKLCAVFSLSCIIHLSKKWIQSEELS